MLTKIRKAARLSPAITQAIQQGIRSNPPTFVDIGARGGLPRQWSFVRKFGLIRPVFFEPDPSAAAEIQQTDAKAIILPYALGSADGKEEVLRVTAAPGQTSVLIPDKMNPFYNSTWDITKELKTKVRRFDAVWDKTWGLPDYVKIDVQGYELEVLKGMGKLLEESLCIELECSFIPFYIGQPVFQEIHDFMLDNGFNLVKIRPLGLYEEKSFVEFNAFFVKSHMHDDPRAKLWKAVNDVGKMKRVVTFGY
ncbi:FkbM family methyltransferase [Microvirga aerophila]|uniref:Methyltransferase FkbM domain-containing protein n=1 Tax=Microvirga aerophila TaxID=670291 RepID=A0A512BWM9_9HYPH|nr:FkbM family methyltransferase [Microvirga aerophila]GEO16359.1 hypothetical protein MAE02_40550 [Microvirga aerophila]